MKEILTGRTDNHIIYSNHFKTSIHKDIEQPLRLLQQQAMNEEGIDLQIISGFRSYQKQLDIWNAKARGERQLLDDYGQPINFASLSPEELLHSILRWSAIPGASRHHWGSDVDIYDRSTMPANYQIELTPEEVAPNGIFAKLHKWLDQQIENNCSYDFFRPYDIDRGGVAPEMWHLSYRPLSQNFKQNYTIDIFRESIESSDLLLKDLIINNLEDIFTNYILATS